MFHFLTTYSLVSATALQCDCFCLGQNSLAMDSSESAIWHHWVVPVEEIWTFASVICPLHTLFSAFPISTPACLFQSSLGVVHLCVISSLDRFLCSSVHYVWPNLLTLVLSGRLWIQTCILGSSSWIIHDVLLPPARSACLSKRSLDPASPECISMS